MVANLDIAPTILAAAGVERPTVMVSSNIIPLGQGRDVAVQREPVLYEYLGGKLPADAAAVRCASRATSTSARAGLWDSDELLQDLRERIRGRCGT